MNKLFAALLTAWNWMTADAQKDIDAGKFPLTEAQMKELTEAGNTITTLKGEKQTAEDALATEKTAHTATTDKLTKAESDLAEAKTKIETLEKAKAGITVSIKEAADKIAADKADEQYLTSFDKEKAAQIAAEK